ncbi:MAG: alpha/beta hydrolase [Clostridia bacterium]|nr:alpha/beta hydrolase [Clostridia bacterium]
MKRFLFVPVALASCGAAAVYAVKKATRAREEGAPDAVAVGGMTRSDKVKYDELSDPKLANSPVVKLMQLMWMATSKKDAANHATQTPPEGIREICDLPYIDDGSRYHLLDVYYPENTEGKNPVIIDVHGGGWMYGDKELNKLYCLALASRGYTVFNMSYRLVPDVTVNEQLFDVMTALTWIGEHIADYPADPADIILTGDSAGGMLAAYAAALTSSDELSEIFETPRPAIDYKGLLLTSPVPYMDPGGYMTLYTPKMWGLYYKEKKTYHYMNFDALLPLATFPKTCLITSAGDILAREQTNRACKDLTAKGVECKLMDFGGEEGKKLEHVFTVINPYNEVGKKTIDEALEFLK